MAPDNQMGKQGIVSPRACELCPRTCGARRAQGERGFCGADDRLVIARAALHHWEEPPISGESGSGTIFFTYCPLHCVYCQNYEIADGRAGRQAGVDDLAEACLSLQDQGALNINFVTPTHYTPQIIEAVRLARDKGLHLPIVWNTSGYERVPVLRTLEGTVDVYLADFKYADPELAQKYSHAPDYPQVALDAIRAMADQVGECRYDEHRGQERLVRGVVVRHLLLPGALEQSKQALRVLYGELGDSVRYSIMNQYTPVAGPAVLACFPELAHAVPSEEYEELLDFADDLGIQDYFWQDGPADSESFIPAWDY